MEKQKKVLHRLELTRPAKAALEAMAADRGMTQFAMLARLVEWFAKEEPLVQAVVLRHIPGEVDGELAKILLKRQK